MTGWERWVEMKRANGNKAAHPCSGWAENLAIGCKSNSVLRAQLHQGRLRGFADLGVGVVLALDKVGEEIGVMVAEFAKLGDALGTDERGRVAAGALEE